MPKVAKLTLAAPCMRVKYRSRSYVGMGVCFGGRLGSYGTGCGWPIGPDAAWGQDVKLQRLSPETDRYAKRPDAACSSGECRWLTVDIMGPPRSCGHLKQKKMGFFFRNNVRYVYILHSNSCNIVEGVRKSADLPYYLGTNMDAVLPVCKMSNILVLSPMLWVNHVSM